VGHAAAGGVGDDALEQPLGHAVAPVGRGDDEARDPDGVRVGRFGAVAEPVQGVVGALRRVDPTGGFAVDVGEVAVGAAAAETLDHLRPPLAPVGLSHLRVVGRRLVGLQAVAGRPLRVAGEAVVVEQLQPVVDAVRRHRLDGDLADGVEPIGRSR